MRHTFVLILSLVILKRMHQSCYAQENRFLRSVSVEDSLKVQVYLDSIGHSSINSTRYQLYWDSALAIMPWKASWWQQKAMPLFKAQKYEVGMPMLDSAVKYNSSRYLEYRAFMKCIFQKSYRDAMADFELAKKLYGNRTVMDHYYDFYIGLCYLQLNRFDSATYFIKSAVETQKKTMGEKWVHFTDLFYMGILSYQNRNYTEAMQYFDKALAQYSNFSDAKYYKAFCLYHLHEKEKALATLLDGEADFKNGYTFTEDNAFYETYPYQVRKSYWTSTVNSFKAEMKP